MWDKVQMHNWAFSPLCNKIKQKKAQVHNLKDNFCLEFTLFADFVDRIGANLPYHSPDLQCNIQIPALISQLLIMTLDPFCPKRKLFTYLRLL